MESEQSESKDTVQAPEESREEEPQSGEREDKESCPVSPAQETPQGSDTASHDTDSPVMINTDVRLSHTSYQHVFLFKYFYIMFLCLYVDHRRLDLETPVRDQMKKIL